HHLQPCPPRRATRPPPPPPPPPSHIFFFFFFFPPPPPPPPPGRPPPPPPFFIRFCTARQSWRGYSGVLIQAWSSSQVKSHFRSGPAITFR
ncbi:hypothetical protein FAN50_17540, partial [Klebsiella pneumoniae]